jgi:hypothetical protein
MAVTNKVIIGQKTVGTETFFKLSNQLIVTRFSIVYNLVNKLATYAIGNTQVNCVGKEFLRIDTATTAADNLGTLPVYSK